MKKALLSIILLLTACMLSAQEYEYPGLKQMQKGNYDAVQKDIDKHLEKDPDDVPYLYAAAKLYSTADYSGRDIPKAYKYMNSCKSKFTRLEPAAQDKLIAKGLSKESLNTAIQDICALALQDAEAVNTEDAYNNFLRAYRSKPSLQRQAKEHLSHLAFEAAAERNTVGSYDFFIEQNPNSSDVKEATIRRNALAYEKAKASNTMLAYTSFINQYPEAEDIPDAWQQVYALALRDAQAKGTNEAIEEYIVTYPESPFTRQQLSARAAELYASFIREGDWQSLKSKVSKRKDSNEQRQLFYAIMQIARKRHSAPAAAYAFQNAPNIDVQDTAWMILHDVYCSTGQTADILKLYSQYPNPRFDELEAHDKKVVQQYNTVQTTDMGWPNFIKLAAPYRIAYTSILRQINENLNRGDIPTALQIVRQYAEAFGDDPSYNGLLSALEQGQQVELIPEAFHDSINTRYQEYSPVITADGNTMYFVRVVTNNYVEFNEDIFTATRDAKGWGKAVPMDALNVPGANEAMQSVSADGTQLIFFRNGMLFSTVKTPDGWSEPEPLPSTINISQWQSDAMISSDGRALLFSAQKQVENELSPSVNIFVSMMDEYGAWSEPIDLGPTINTPGLERKPFLHPDMRTLYFSSDGHGTLGDLDVFKSTRLSDDSWTEWSEPVNLGAQVNSPRQEWGYKISTDGSIAYYSNGDDLFMLELPVSMRPNAVATISGTVRDDSGQTVGVTIRWEDLDTHESIGHSQTDPGNGAFYLVLPLGKNYGYYIDDERYFPVSNNIDLTNEKESVNIVKNITLTSYRQMIEQGMSVQVNNLFFPVNEWELLPQSENELIRIAAILKERNMRVEISGHTDSTGDPKKNITLSKQRAESVRSFLIKQGCNASLLVAKGYGATRPIADNDTDEGKQMNRRVELQFLK